MAFAEALRRPYSPTRRNVVTQVSTGIIGTGFLLREQIGQNAAALVQALLTTPAKDIGLPHSLPDFSPGWIEQDVKVPFIQVQEQGHRDWLHQAVFNNETMFGITRAFGSELTQYHKNGERAKPGDLLKKALNAADWRIVRAQKQGLDISQQERQLECTHAGVVALAAPLLPWFKEPDFISLGFPVARFDSFKQFYWGKYGMGTLIFPKLFGINRPETDDLYTAKGQEPQYAGQDRTIHFAQYTLLAFEYLYAKHFGLSEASSFPVGMQKAIDFLETVHAPKEAQTAVIAQAAGMYYEILGTLNDYNRPFPLGKNRGNIHEGLFDVMVRADLKANILGMLTGIALFKRAESGKSLQPLFDELNYAKFGESATAPYLHSIDPGYAGGEKAENPKLVEFANFLLNIAAPKAA